MNKPVPVVLARTRIELRDEVEAKAKLAAFEARVAELKAQHGLAEVVVAEKRANGVLEIVVLPCVVEESKKAVAKVVPLAPAPVRARPAALAPKRVSGVSIRGADHVG